MKLIGLNGLKRSGKDTAYDFIEAALGASDSEAYRAAFADNLKYAAMMSLSVSPDMSLEFADYFKEGGEIAVAQDGEFQFGIMGRKYLQNFGATGRAIFGKNFWLDQVLPASPAQFEEQYLWVDVLVVTDVRYPNEAERVREYGGEVWNIRRPGLEPDGHSSESPLPLDLVDRIIHNDGTLDEFEVKVLEALHESF